MESKSASVSASRAMLPAIAAGMAILYVFVIGHTPLAILPGYLHDDGLYLRLGENLASGLWLGKYNQYTLMKGPGYPIFLALSNWTGFSLAISRAIFHCISIGFFVYVAHFFLKSALLSITLFILVLWSPLPMTVIVDRLLREQIYYMQTLIVLAVWIALLFGPPSWPKVWLAVSGGVVFGWFWLTREEGIWVLPGIFLMITAAGIYAYRDNRLRNLAGPVLILAVTFAIVQAAFAATNWFAYGSFVGVDFKERNFQSALGAINSVRSGGTKPFVAITYEAMDRVAEVSPKFKSLLTYLKGKDGQMWATFGCLYRPTACGEIGSGWFMWALRDAVASKGAYASPAKAARFYGRLANEVQAACRQGTLECDSQMLKEMPPWKWDQLLDGLGQRYVEALRMVILLDPPRHLNRSEGPERVLKRALHFLNFPPQQSAAANSTKTYTINGWYFREGDEWFVAEMIWSDGKGAPTSTTRVASPDLQTTTGDALASRQRFVIESDCNPDCTLRIANMEGRTVEKRLGDLPKRLSAVPIGNGHFQIESVEQSIEPHVFRTSAEIYADSVRIFVLDNYKWIQIPFLVLGFISLFLSTIFYTGRAVWNICYIISLATLCLVIVRLTLVILVHQTSFPALTEAYLSPANFLLVASCGFACAAWWQLFKGATSGRSARQSDPLS